MPKCLTEQEVYNLGNAKDVKTASECGVESNRLCTYHDAELLGCIAQSGYSLSSDQIVYEGSIRQRTECAPRSWGAHVGWARAEPSKIPANGGYVQFYDCGYYRCSDGTTDSKIGYKNPTTRVYLNQDSYTYQSPDHSSIRLTITK